MGARGSVQHASGDGEFEAFVAGAAARLLHAATLLTAEPTGANPTARALLREALARTYARWDRLRDDDPYAHARRELCAAYARTAWRRHHAGEGPLGGLPPRLRLVLVLRLYEGVAEETVAAQLGLSPERVRARYARALAALTAPRPRRAS
ncbi:sigma factor-like helix-turn-helix DNA-binding protein [Streptomyces sp. NPDC097619]|uniref:sigma factor-like helix-turn-helix DNA-binding protein n=1 Tax=Streptomyces sp. NPDC097619 TaxID=3157228 RepID=UPI0033342D67